MSSRLLSFSLCLNVFLLGMTGLWIARRHGGSALPAPEQIQITSPSSEQITTATAPLPVRWSELESEDYAIYVGNLRRAGCPERVLRRIISADLKDLYVQKAFSLVQQFHHDFWEIAAKENVRFYYDATLAQQVKALCGEPDRVLDQLVGASEAPVTSEPEATRQSGALDEVQQLYGVDFTERELRNIAKVIDDYHRGIESQPETDAATLDQNLQAALGPERFAELNRARSASFRELYELVSDFDLPKGTAAEIFDLRLTSEKESNAIRADKSRSADDKQVLLDELEDSVEQTVRTKLGTDAFKSYKGSGGRWIDGVGRL